MAKLLDKNTLYIAIVAMFFSVPSPSRGNTSQLYQFFPADIAIYLPQNSTVKKTKYDEFVKYEIMYQGEKIIVEVGSRHYGDLAYIIPNNATKFKLPQFEEANVYQWSADGGKTYNSVSAFSSANGYNVLLSYHLDAKKRYIGNNFAKSLLIIRK